MASDRARERLARERSLPAVPRSLPPDAVPPLSAMREQVERLSGRTGDQDDRAVRLFEIKQGLLDAYLRAAVAPGKHTQPGAGGGRVLKAPRNLKYDHQIFAIRLTWDNVEEDYSHVEIWVSEDSQSLDDAVLMGVATKPLGEWSLVGVSLRVNYYFWIRAVGFDGGVSPWCPPQGQGGLLVPADLTKTIEEILEILQGRITESQLYQELASRIDLIDGTGPGSVSARIDQERTERVSGDQAVSRRVDTLRTSVNGNTAAVQQHASALNGLRAQWFVKTDVNGRVAGIGLHNSGATSEFIVLADRFAVIAPGQDRRVPFVVGPVGSSGRYGVGIDGGMVVNGSILTRHLDAGAVTAEKIGANQIGARHVAARNITADKIGVGQIRAEHLTAGLITADKIAAGQIAAWHIAARGITADRIAAGQIRAEHLAAGSVTADKIAAGAINADYITVGTLRAARVEGALLQHGTGGGSLQVPYGHRVLVVANCSYAFRSGHGNDGGGFALLRLDGSEKGRWDFDGNARGVWSVSFVCSGGFVEWVFSSFKGRLSRVPEISYLVFT